MNQNKTGVAMLTSDKVDFGATNITKDKESHYIIIKPLYQKVRHLNSIPNNRA